MDNKLGYFEHKEFFICNGMTLFTFYALPCSVKLNGVLVHSCYSCYQHSDELNHNLKPIRLLKMCVE